MEGQMTVYADCEVCEARHPLGAREAVPCTTMCPHCGARPYATVSPSTSVTDPATIRRTVQMVDGVGPQTARKVARYVRSLNHLTSCNPETLGANVDGVGSALATRIVTAVSAQ